MAKLTLNSIGSRYGSIDALNDNFDAIETAFENTFSRDGTGPNTLEATLDANSQRIINLPDPVGNTEPATKGWVIAQPGQAAASAVAAAASAAAAAVSETNAEEAAEQVVDWEWKNEWATGIVYQPNNIVSIPSGTYEGWSFICIVAHTAGAVFATDYSAGKWEILAKRGSTGIGTGDMLAANNLSDLTNFSAARTNLSVPSATGVGASGTWGIAITGNAATSTNAINIANGAAGAPRIVGIAAKRLADYPVLSVTAADTHSAETGSNPLPLATRTDSQTEVVAYRYTISKYTGSLRFRTSQGGGNFSAAGYGGVYTITTTSTLRIFKNGTLIQTYSQDGPSAITRTNDIAVVPGDVIEWRHKTNDSRGSVGIGSTVVLGSNSYTARELFLQATEVNNV